ncbi:OmpH family outer membrane protein [Gracilinema caldarium]|uniref:Outer membrane chaperone Skp (OmpH) n=1 Tax=Gracilinema caldarium (strain ATCC 51460 / DSM 7334 / H1) TaxID=744872 RepID=F8F2V0_GRAC1|nr:OmpH family outer membrane protein [Gracilinema caldarium]AEJ19494.1 outer membrane chaperone Skp (OmpH) [Gracilinema caldarium DSM 7334]
MEKKHILPCVVLLLIATMGVSAQQLTRFAVVDLPKIYTVFFKDSKAVRDFEERSARVQADIDKMNNEIQTLQKNRLDAVNAGDQQKVLSLDNEIYKKTEYLKEYYRIKTAELEEQRKKLTQSDSFLKQVYDEIRIVAESDGYSMVLNLKESSGILWYSPTVDITDKVINNLLTKAGR